MKPKPIEENETQRVSEGTGLRVRIAQTEEKEWFDRVVEENHELGAGKAVGDYLRQVVERRGVAVFERNGIKRIEALGQPLDPNRHQAMVEIPSADAEPGTIIQEMQSGYMIRDRLLRPALVGVAKEG